MGEFETADPGSTLLYDAAVDDRRRLTVPARALTAVSWRDEIRAGASVTFELSGRGEARMLPGATFDEAFASTTEAEVVAALSMLLVRGRWTTRASLTIPRPVATHLFDGALCGPIFVYVRRNCLELWSNERRLLGMSRARSIAAEHLPP